MLLEPDRQLLVDHALDDRAHLGGHELVLGLRGELGIRHLDRQHAGQALAAVVAGEADLLAAARAVLLGIGADLPGERGAQAGEMGAAVALRDVVREEQHVLVVGIVPPHRRLDDDVVALAAHDDRRRDDRLLGAVEPADEGLDAAVVVHLLAPLLDAAAVGERDLDAGVEEGELAQPVLQRRPRELGLRERAGARQEGHLGARLAPGVADHLERALRHAVGELEHVLLAVAPDPERQLRGQRVDDGDADAVQAAGDLVGVLVELTAGMQLGHDDLGRRHALAGVHLGRDAAAVVGHRHRAVGIEEHVDRVAIARQRLVDRVVDDLVDHVVQAGAVVRVADIHAGTLAHRVEALQDLDRFGAVFGGGSGFGPSFLHAHGHSLGTPRGGNGKCPEGGRLYPAESLAG